MGNQYEDRLKHISQDAIQVYIPHDHRSSQWFVIHEHRVDNETLISVSKSRVTLQSEVWAKSNGDGVRLFFGRCPCGQKYCGIVPIANN